MLHKYRVWLLVLIAGASVGGVYLFVAPIPQDLRYHEFADRRLILDIPRFGDVVSNAPFTLAGILGLGALYRGWFGVPAQDPAARVPYAVFFLGVLLVGPASGWYHADPNNETLVLDRIFLAVAFMGLFTAILADRVHHGWSLRWGLLLLVVAGAGSVAAWSLGEARGAGDLRAYFLVQFLPMALVPVILWMFPEGRLVKSWFIAGALLIYVLAKTAEVLDREIFELFAGTVSGHTIKHLLAALCPVVVIAMMQRWPIHAAAGRQPFAARRGKGCATGPRASGSAPASE